MTIKFLSVEMTVKVVEPQPAVRPDGIKLVGII